MPNFVRIGQAKNGDVYCKDEDTGSVYKFKPVKVESGGLPPEIVKVLIDNVKEDIAIDKQLGVS